MGARSPLKDKKQRIAVIGAGMAGLTAALELRHRGYTNVDIFEKESDVGGKIKTTVYQNRPYEMGAIIFSRQFRMISELAATYHQEHFDAATPSLVQKDGKLWTYFDFIRDRCGILNFTQAARRILTSAMWRDSKCQEAGFGQNAPTLFKTMSTFSESAHIAPAVGCIQSFMTGCGYGYYDEIPALYLMKLAPIVVKDLVACGLSFGLHQSWQLFTKGWQQLCRDMAADLRVHLNSPVSSVHRQHGSPIKITTKGSSELFDTLIITAPVDAVLGFLDCTEQERRLFQRVRYLRYMVTLIEAEGLVTASFADHISASSAGHINFLVQPYPDTNVFLVYQLLTDTITADEATDLASADISKIGGRVLKLITRKEWRYFPHVGPKDLAAGYYPALEGLQGEQATYYGGSLFGFETTEHTALYARALIRRYF
ncbi:MAG: FAD-dependent oxidoreductase [Deltaproteobacteria bacterium]|nr:FAD-dependent oxidoreductase [Deltaproteobacteria bacterium]